MGRLDRNKRKKKAMTFYKIVFRFKPPYHILVDPDFIKHMVDKKLDMKYQLGKLLDEKVIVFMTSCVIKYLEQGDKEAWGESLAYAKKFPCKECTHDDTLAPTDCVWITVCTQKDLNAKNKKTKADLKEANDTLNATSTTGKKRKRDEDVVEEDEETKKTKTNKGTKEEVEELLNTEEETKYAKEYIIGAVDSELKKRMRNIPGVPLVYTQNNTIFLEKPSLITKKFAFDSGELGRNLSSTEMQALEEIKEEEEQKKQVKITGKKRKLGRFKEDQVPTGKLFVRGQATGQRKKNHSKNKRRKKNQKMSS